MSSCNTITVDISTIIIILITLLEIKSQIAAVQIGTLDDVTVFGWISEISCSDK